MCTVVVACGVPAGWPRRQSREQDKTQKSCVLARQAGVRKYFVVTFGALDAQTGDPPDRYDISRCVFCTSAPSGVWALRVDRVRLLF